MRHLAKTFLIVALLFPLSASANTYTVNNTNDWFWGSLRQAIEDANNHPGLDTIVFAIGSGQKTIKLDTPLPIITDAVLIDGWTQPGWNGQPLIELDGTKVTTDTGLRISATSTIRGLVINRFGLHGIGIGDDFNGHNNPHGTVIQGCWIGVGLDGLSQRPNQRDGITIYANDCLIGGDAPHQRNVIASNGRNGITNGSHMWSGQTSGARGHRTRVRGNHIGVDATGLVSRGNGHVGVKITGGTDVVIGGDTPSVGNIISGNGSEGIWVGLSESSGGVDQYIARTLVKNNKIGVSANGSAMGNGYWNGSLPGILTHGPQSTIVQNVIANNNSAGVQIKIKSGTQISNNTMYGNVGLGIDLSFYDETGVTPNDGVDADGGGNGLLNYPVLTGAVNESNYTNVYGTYQGAPNQTFMLEFFKNSSCDSSGYGEGHSLAGTASVSTNASGAGTFAVALLQPQAALGSFITATARDAAGSTSEFSQCRTVTSGLPPTVTGFTPQGGRPGTAVTISGTNLNWISTVKFFNGTGNGANAAFTIVNRDTINAIVPTGAKTGRIQVSGPYGYAWTAASSPFKVTPPAGDLSGDGKPDLLWRNYRTGQNSIWVTGGAYVILATVSDVNWHIQGTGDFNNDGSHDILWRHYGTGQNSIWFMNGTSYLSSVMLTSFSDTNWHVNAVGDFDGDGDPDLVWRNYSTGDGLIWRMNGASFGGLTTPLQNVAVAWRIEAAGDFNLDGATDLLWRNYSTGDVSIWHMNGPSWSGVYTMLPRVTDANWIIEGASDWDQDGDVDIVWRNPTTGQNSVWFLIGAYWNGSSYVLLDPVADSDWRIEDQ